MSKDFFIDCDNMNIHALLEYPKQKEKEYPLLIIFHGLTGHMQERHILAIRDTALRCDYATLRVEFYGHGQSDGNFSDHTILHWLTQAMRIIDYAQSLKDISQIYLCGHSQGGLTAILASGMMPSHIAGLIALSPATNIAENPDTITASIKRKGLTLKEDYYEAAKILPLNICISHYPGPILLIHGTQDQTVPFAYALQLAKKEKQVSNDFTFREIKGADHNYTGNHQLEEVTQIISDFLVSHKKDV